MNIIDNQTLIQFTELMRKLHGGKWSWEESKYNGRSSWDLYSNRGAKIIEDQPEGFGNQQHGMKILRGEHDTFDATGEAMREFIVMAQQYLPAMIYEIQSWRSVFTQANNIANDYGFRMETPEQRQERRRRAIESLEHFAHATDSDWADIEDDAIKG